MFKLFLTPMLVVGIGMTAVVRRKDLDQAKSVLEAAEIGRIERGTGKTRLVF